MTINYGLPIANENHELDCLVCACYNMHKAVLVGGDINYNSKADWNQFTRTITHHYLGTVT